MAMMHTGKSGRSVYEMKLLGACQLGANATISVCEGSCSAVRVVNLGRIRLKDLLWMSVGSF